MNIDHLRLFLRIATLHNISQAGAEIGLSAAVASAHLNKLETGLGVRLFHRSTRSVTLSEEGKAFLPHAEEVLASIEAARASVGSGSIEPMGTLRMTASASFGRQHLVPAIDAFMQQYPQIKIDLRLSDTIMDLVEGGFDLAIRNAPLKDSSLVARKLAPDLRIVTASPGYLEQHGEPSSPQDIAQHTCISLMNMDTWTFAAPEGDYSVKVNSRFSTDNGETMRDACCAGMGLAINSTWNCHKQLQDGSLVQVLKDHPLLMDVAVWAVYPSSRMLAPKVRAMIDFLLNWFGSIPYWDSPLHSPVPPG